MTAVLFIAWAKASCQGYFSTIIIRAVLSNFYSLLIDPISLVDMSLRPLIGRNGFVWGWSVPAGYTRPRPTITLTICVYNWLKHSNLD
jgi:hypothetical protein